MYSAYTYCEIDDVVEMEEESNCDDYMDDGLVVIDDLYVNATYFSLLYIMLLVLLYNEEWRGGLGNLLRISNKTS